MASQHPKMTASSGSIDPAALLDENLNTSVKMAAPKDGGAAWLQFSSKDLLRRGRCRSERRVGFLLAVFWRVMMAFTCGRWPRCLDRRVITARVFGRLGFML